MKTRRRFCLVYIGVALLVAVWTFGSSNVNASEPPPADTLPEYTGGLRYNHVKPYVGEEVQPGVDVNASNLVGNESEVSIDVNPTNRLNQVIGTFNTTTYQAAKILKRVKTKNGHAVQTVASKGLGSSR